MQNEDFCLQWNDFAENVSGAFKELRTECDFFDVTLACTDSGAKTLQAHKVILSACSNFFKSMFRQQNNANKHPNPYIYLRGVTYSDLTSILDFIYNGEAFNYQFFLDVALFGRDCFKTLTEIFTVMTTNRI